MNTQKGNGVIALLFVVALVGAFAGLIFSIDVTTPTEAQNPMRDEMDKVTETQAKLIQAVPIPDLQTSSERANVAKRAQIFNNEEKISYIYLVSYGKVMAFFTVQGKVSSLQSYMTPQEKIVRADGRDCDKYESASYCFVVSAPDVDGTYGDNVEGIFFFTTEGAYVEWKGEYMMSDQPLKLATPPELVREIK